MPKFKSPRSLITYNHYRSETTKLHFAIGDYLSTKSHPDFVEANGDTNALLHDLLIFAEQWWLKRNRRSLEAFRRAEAKKKAKA